MWQHQHLPNKLQPMKQTKAGKYRGFSYINHPQKVLVLVKLQHNPAQPILDHFTPTQTLAHSLVHLIQQECQTSVSLQTDAYTCIEGKMLNMGFKKCRK